MTTEFDPLALFTQMPDPHREEEPEFEFGDQERLKREAKRRKRLGQLRARPQPSKRPTRGVEQFYK